MAEVEWQFVPMKITIEKSKLIGKISLALVLGISACAAPQPQFMDNLRAICGQSFSGRLVSNDPVDADMRLTPMTMEVVTCTPNEIRIPFHVGENRSRTWVITHNQTGLRLKHQHNHQDGSEDTLSQYGGDTANPGTATRQEFPVDEFSKQLFEREGLQVSMTNIWAVEITPKMYAYELRRQNRHFRVEFDLTQPVAAPPPAW